jgi:Holliday junction resolvasome RuvABC endonuclease subunit
MKIIAFDLGRNFAFAHNLSKRPATHLEVLTGETRAHRLGSLSTFLNNLFFDYQSQGSPGFDIAVYETPFARGRDATRSLWGIAGIIEACATNAGLPVVDVAVPTIKKFATGHGKASKDQMIIAAKRMGYKGSNEHEADAVCLLRYAEANLERVLDAK